MNISNIAILYVNLILAGRKKFSEVPYYIKPEVRELLIELGREDLLEL